MKLRYSKRALEQIDKALGYVAEPSPSGDAKIEARLRAILALVQIQPQAGVRTRLSGVRRIFITPIRTSSTIMRATTKLSCCGSATRRGTRPQFRGGRDLLAPPSGESLPCPLDGAWVMLLNADPEKWTVGNPNRASRNR